MTYLNTSCSSMDTKATIQSHINSWSLRDHHFLRRVLDSIAHAFITTWVSRFGVPLNIISDRGSQFESSVWNKVMTLLGICRIRTSSCHPQANSTVERFHRQLKSSQAASTQRENWSLSILLIVLVIKIALKTYLYNSIAEIVYGTTLRLPGGNLATIHDPKPCNIQDFSTRLKSSMKSFQPVQPRASPTKTLQTARVDVIKKSLQQQYQGPFKENHHHRQTWLY
ncbi:uncharacterized protein LOC135106212 [Scylla paramamosain]|uniref:uncharacterized protein LOC135106212 n=1 Tax=Scylla paramamosain TaxID=85552 RepID=UPI003082EED4